MWVARASGSSQLHAGSAGRQRGEGAHQGREPYSHCHQTRSAGRPLPPPPPSAPIPSPKPHSWQQCCCWQHLQAVMQVGQGSGAASQWHEGVVQSQLPELPTATCAPSWGTATCRLPTGRAERPTACQLVGATLAWSRDRCSLPAMCPPTHQPFRQQPRRRRAPLVGTSGVPQQPLPPPLSPGGSAVLLIHAPQQPHPPPHPPAAAAARYCSSTSVCCQPSSMMRSRGAQPPSARLFRPAWIPAAETRE